jgi:hypothetical protein
MDLRNERRRRGVWAMAHSYGEPMLQGILFSNPNACLDMQHPPARSLHRLAITPLNPPLRGLQPTFHLA